MSFNRYKVLKLDYDGKNDSIPFQYKLDINNSDFVENEISLNLELEFEVPTDNENKERIDLSLNIKSDKYQNVQNNFYVKKKLSTNDNEIEVKSNDNGNSLKIELDTMINKLNKSMETHTQNIHQINKRVYQNRLPIIEEEEEEVDPKNKIIQDKMSRAYEKKLLSSTDFEINQNKIMRVYNNKEINQQMKRIYQPQVIVHKDINVSQDRIHRVYQEEKEDGSKLFLREMSRAYQDKRVTELKSENNVERDDTYSKIQDEKKQKEIELDKKVHLIQEEIMKSFKKKNNITKDNETEYDDLTLPKSFGSSQSSSPVLQKTEVNSQTFIRVDDVLKNSRPKKQPEIQKQSSKNLVTLLNKNDVSLEDIELAPSTTDESVDNKLFYHLKLLLSVDSINISTNIVYIVTELMKFVDNFDLAGKDKKSVIINTIHKYLLDANTEKNIDYIINTICPELVDILISIDKRKIKIKQKMNCFIPWCS